MQQGLANYKEAEWSGRKVELRARAGFPLEPTGVTKDMRSGKAGDHRRGYSPWQGDTDFKGQEEETRVRVGVKS